MEMIASDGIIDQAYEWLCERRKEYSANSDVWHLRWQWEKIKPRLKTQLLAGEHRLRANARFTVDGKTIELLSSLDALVLKAVALVLTEHLKPHLSPHCYHIAGHGGLKGAVRAVAENLADNKFVLRSDVLSYYASIDHEILYDLACPYILDQRVRDLLWAYMRRTVYEDGIYRDITRGIPLGCSLSPLMGALYLKPLDDRITETGLFYARFMDDWVTLSPTRWKLRKAVKLTNQILADLHVEKHPDKTYIGKISKGFDFLGYSFTPQGLGVAQKTIDRHLERLDRLYEQGADSERIGQYIRRWRRWVRAGVELDYL